MKKDKELYQRCVEAVDARLSGKRLAHVHSVSACAKKLAKIYGAPVFDAKIAGLLHDWDKLYTDDELPARMDELGIPQPKDIEYLFPVLHSFTGAKAVRLEFPDLTDEIESAIWHHTLGDIEMTPLDMVVFVADSIEPLRSAKYRPELEEIRAMVGEASLEELYFATYEETMRSLIKRRRFIHPMAFDIWNGLVAKYHPVDKSRQGRSDIVL